MRNLFNHAYPYTDDHELNLDWLIVKMKELQIQFDEFKVVNEITFSGAWDITKQYPAWTIVSDNNIGYVSIKPVPAGVLLTNGDYWREVIDYTAQIAGLQNRVIALENEDIVINGRIANINNDINVINAEDIILIGDSYGIDATAGGDSWTSQIERNYTKGIVYRSTVGGTGFASDLYISDNFLSMIQGLTIADADKVKQIIILAGGNDANLYYDGTATIANIKDRIDSFMTYCKTTFPNAIVKVSFVAWYRNTNRYAAYRMIKYVYEDTVENYDNAAYFSNGEVIMHNINLINSLDLIHPVQTASDKLADFAMSMITGGNYNDYYIQTPTLTPDSSVASIQGLVSSKIVYDGCDANLSLIGNNYNAYINVTWTNAITLDGNLTMAAYIGSLDNIPMVLGADSEYTTIPVLVGIENQGTHKATALVLLNDDKLVIRVFNIDGATSGWAVKAILIPPFTYHIDRRTN